MVSMVAQKYWSEVLDLRTPVSDDRRERRSAKNERRALLRKVVRTQGTR